MNIRNRIRPTLGRVDDIVKMRNNALEEHLKSYIQKAIDLAGSMHRLSVLLGRDGSYVAQAMRRRSIPYLHSCASRIEQEFYGKMKEGELFAKEELFAKGEDK